MERKYERKLCEMWCINVTTDRALSTVVANRKLLKRLPNLCAVYTTTIGRFDRASEHVNGNGWSGYKEKIWMKSCGSDSRVRGFTFGAHASPIRNVRSTCIVSCHSAWVAHKTMQRGQTIAAKVISIRNHFVPNIARVLPFHNVSHLFLLANLSIYLFFFFYSGRIKLSPDNFANFFFSISIFTSHLCARNVLYTFAYELCNWNWKTWN